jgi:segregation and condensation protein B
VPAQEPLALLDDDFALPEPETAEEDGAAEPEPAEFAQPAAETEVSTGPEPAESADPVAGGEASAEPAQPSDGSETESVSSTEPAVPTAEEAAAAEAAAKRLARLRDREARDVIRQILDELIAEYAADARGIEVREIAGGYRMATKPACHDAVRLFVKSLKPPLKLSLPALETLAVIAYKQPVTAPEVNEIRGVDSSAVFGSLLARKLIATAGRKPVIGRPILYKTTREFLLRFGLKDVSELPSMEEFEKMAALELEEPEFEPAGESALSPETKAASDPRLEFDQDGTEAPEEEARTEAAPAELSPTEQAETETLPHAP